MLPLTIKFPKKIKQDPIKLLDIIRTNFLLTTSSIVLLKKDKANFSLLISSLIEEFRLKINLITFSEDRTRIEEQFKLEEIRIPFLEKSDKPSKIQLRKESKEEMRFSEITQCSSKLIILVYT